MITPFARIVAAITVGFAWSAHAAPAVVFDVVSDRVLYAEAADRPVYPASLTKLMTAYLTFEAVKSGKLSWQSALIVSANANAQPPVKLGARTGEHIPLDLAVRVMIVRSANDVAVALAEAVSGNAESFVEQMNVTAHRLGMSRTHFANPSGLPDPQQISTARDIALLARAILRDHPEQAAAFANTEVRVGRRRLTTVNGLLVTFAGADGMKTGFTCAAGYNVVASATRDGRKLIAVVLSETSRAARATRAASLLENGFKETPEAMGADGIRIDTMAFVPAEALAPVDLSKTVRSPVCGNHEPGPVHPMLRVQMKPHLIAHDRSSQEYRPF